MQAFILAGGNSTRFGAPKALVDFNGKPLIVHQIELLRKLTCKIAILANQRDHYRQFNLPIYSDIYPHRGPIAGIHGGLQYSRENINLFIACDLPFLSFSFLQYMLDQSQKGSAIIPHTPDGYHPTCAIYRKSCLSVFENQILSGNNKISDTFNLIKIHELHPIEVDLFNLTGNLLKNLNRYDDYQKAIKSF